MYSPVRPFLRELAIRRGGGKNDFRSHSRLGRRRRRVCLASQRGSPRGAEARHAQAPLCARIWRGTFSRTALSRIHLSIVGLSGMRSCFLLEGLVLLGKGALVFSKRASTRRSPGRESDGKYLPLGQRPAPFSSALPARLLFEAQRK
ncbi:hypothetical protein HPB48_005158 [Haemaphysalis longicornis]|uniref:Uncharacterized protein n=1 Tax=Haemaphysalis longicornis TaxID=44386 RepID=A0A9J6FH55_HAELO|nr:hypothetical protein HPB48_005158 [Haemaphysalis longicornis]